MTTDRNIGGQFFGGTMKKPEYVLFLDKVAEECFNVKPIRTNDKAFPYDIDMNAILSNRCKDYDYIIAYDDKFGMVYGDVRIYDKELVEQIPDISPTDPYASIQFKINTPISALADNDFDTTILKKNGVQM